MSRKRPMSHVLIVDPLKLRRAAMSLLLSDWAAANDLVICCVEPPRSSGEFIVQSNTRLIIYVSGSRPVGSDEYLVDIRGLLGRDADTPLVVVTDSNSRSDSVAAYHAGARACVAASMDPELTLRVLTFVLQGGTYFPPDVLLCPDISPCDQGPCTHGIRGVTAASEDELHLGEKRTLTSRQMEVASLLRHGLSNKSIARNLDMAEATVKVHVRQIMRKLGVRNRTQVAILSSERDSEPVLDADLPALRHDN